MTPTSLQRLHNQCISKPHFQKPEEVVRFMGAMQAQDYEMSKWAVGVRMNEATDDLVESAISEGRILRTHVLRPTWHLVSPEDIRWMLDLSAQYVLRQNSSIDRFLGIDEDAYQLSAKIIEKALTLHGTLTREEIMVFLSEKGLNIAENRPAHYMFYAEMNALVCSGPRKGKQQTYMLLDERVPSAAKRSREENVAELTLRYFRSHGPATIKDFSWWSGLNQTEIKKGIEACGKALFSETRDGKMYWMAEQPFVFKEKGVFVLPAFDEFTVSYADRSPSMRPDTGRTAILSNGIFKPIIVENGEVTGIWKRTVKPKKVLVDAMILQTKRENTVTEINTAFDSYQKFMGKPLSIAVQSSL